MSDQSVDKLSGNSDPIHVRKLSKDNGPSLETKPQGHLGRDGCNVNVTEQLVVQN